MHAFQLVVTYDLWSTGSFQHAVRGGPGACSPEKSETLRDIIFSILGHTCIWVTSFSQTLMLGSVQNTYFLSLISIHYVARAYWLQVTTLTQSTTCYLNLLVDRWGGETLLWWELEEQNLWRYMLFSVLCVMIHVKRYSGSRDFKMFWSRHPTLQK